MAPAWKYEIITKIWLHQSTCSRLTFVTVYSI